MIALTTFPPKVDNDMLVEIVGTGWMIMITEDTIMYDFKDEVNWIDMMRCVLIFSLVSVDLAGFRRILEK